MNLESHISIESSQTADLETGSRNVCERIHPGFLHDTAVIRRANLVLGEARSLKQGIWLQFLNGSPKHSEICVFRQMCKSLCLQETVGMELQQNWLVNDSFIEVSFHTDFIDIEYPQFRFHTYTSLRAICSDILRSINTSKFRTHRCPCHIAGSAEGSRFAAGFLAPSPDPYISLDADSISGRLF